MKRLIILACLLLFTKSAWGTAANPPFPKPSEAFWQTWEKRNDNSNFSYINDKVIFNGMIYQSPSSTLYSYKKWDLSIVVKVIKDPHPDRKDWEIPLPEEKGWEIPLPETYLFGDRQSNPLFSYKENKFIYTAYNKADSDLLEYIKDNKNKLEEDDIRHILRQLVKDLQSAQQAGQEYANNFNLTNPDRRGFLHRDIKPENVLVYGKDAEGRLIVSLADWGYICVPNEEGKAFTNCGTPFYVSPEICGSKAYTKASDIYSLGILLATISMKTHPFPLKDSNGNSITRSHLVDTRMKARDLAGRGYTVDLLPNLEGSEPFKDLVRRMTDINPDERPDLEDILNSDWMTVESPSLKRKFVEEEPSHKNMTQNAQPTCERERKRQRTNREKDSD